MNPPSFSGNQKLWRRLGLLLAVLAWAVMFIANLPSATLHAAIKPAVLPINALGIDTPGWGTYDGTYLTTYTARTYVTNTSGSHADVLLPLRQGSLNSAWRLQTLKMISNPQVVPLAYNLLERRCVQFAVSGELTTAVFQIQQYPTIDLLQNDGNLPSSVPWQTLYSTQC